jgi:hypothetical protein
VGAPAGGWVPVKKSWHDCGTMDHAGAYPVSECGLAPKEVGAMRIAVATFFGILMGVFCASALFWTGTLKFAVVTLVWVLLNRAVMGFAIGASGLKLHWAWNGIVMGVVVGSIFSFFLYMTLGVGLMPVANIFANGVFGLLIEFFTTVVCRQRAMARN